MIIADISDGTKLADELNKKYGSGRVLFVKTDVSDQDCFESEFVIFINSILSCEIFRYI